MRFLSRLAPHLLVLTLPATVLVSCSEYNLWEDPDEENPRTDTGDDIDPNAPAPDIRVEPAEISFGWRLVDCPAVPQTVTVTNVGDAELDVTDIRLEGAGAATFNLIGGPAKLAPTESFTFQVGFTAGAETEYTVEVQVDSNDPDTPIAVVDAKGSGAQTAINEQIFTQPDVGDVDVLWVVDNSGSMSDIVSHLGDRFESFLNSFDTLGIDYRIAVVSTDMDTDGHKGIFQGPTPVIQKGVGDPVSEFRQATDLGASGSGAEKGADAAYAALTSPLIDNENAGFLREDAVLAVVVISDEDDSSSIGDSTFTSWLDAYKGDPSKTSFSAVVGDGGSLFGCSSSSFPPVSATPGTRYIRYQEATGGTFQSICDEDFDQVLAYLGYGASGLSFEFPLEKEPRSLSGIKVTVDGVEVKRSLRDGWIYDSVSNSVRFSKAAVPGPNAVVVISYPVDEDC